MMRRWISGLAVFALACLLVLPVGAAGDEMNGAPGPDTQTVQLPTGSFIFTTPNGWTMDNSQNQDPVAVTLFGPDSGLRTLMEVYPQTNSLDDEIAFFQRIVRQSQLQGSVTGEATQDLTIGNEAAKAYAFSGTRQDGSAVSGQITVVYHDGQVYTFITLADAPTLPSADDLSLLLGSVGFLA